MVDVNLLRWWADGMLIWALLPDDPNTANGLVVAMASSPETAQHIAVAHNASIGER